MRFFPKGRRWERWGRPTLLSPAEWVLEEGSVVDRGEDLWEHRGEVGSWGEFFEELSGG